jgi:hypothetical protein
MVFAAALGKIPPLTPPRNRQQETRNSLRMVAIERNRIRRHFDARASRTTF